MTDKVIQELREEIVKLRERVAVLERYNQADSGSFLVGPGNRIPHPPIFPGNLPIPRDPLVPPWNVTCSVGVIKSTMDKPCQTD